jgi:hypothetical protein
MHPNCTYDLKTMNAYFTAWLRHCVPLCSLIFAGILFSQSAISQCTPPSMTFKTPTLISGTGGSVGAVYLFTDVIPGVDATIQVMALVGGAGLNQMDNTSQGYYDAWQPYVTAGGNATSYLDWKITFKKGGTMIDSILPCLAITAVDIDGDNSRLREFIVASTPGAYAVDPFTYLTVGFDGVNSTATGQVYTVPSIDTAETQYMFQMNFNNVSTIYYRNGSISTKPTIDVRHTCIYFKSFFDTEILLPLRIVSFTAKNAHTGIALDWTVADEKDVLYYTVQKSKDGTSWGDIGKVNAQPGVLKYSFVDPVGSTGKIYYRLKQTATYGDESFSRMIGINNAGGSLNVTIPTMVANNNIAIELEAPEKEVYHFAVYNSQGSVVKQRSYSVQAGINNLQLDVPAQSPSGVYMVAVRNTQGVVVSRTRILVQ